MKIAIIGFGAAAIGFIEKIKDTGEEIHIFEKSRDIYSSSISGIRADGKLFVSGDMGGDLDVSLELQKELVDFWINKTSSRNVETGHSFSDPIFYKKFYDQGFLPVISDFYHLGTEQLKEILYRLHDDFSNYDNIKFHFNREIKKLEKTGEGWKLNGEDAFDFVLVSVGRSGHRFIKSIINEFPGLIADNTKVDLGVRFEMPDLIVEELNKEMYEFKIKFKSRTGYLVRTFCNNPSGYVVTENYGEYVTVNGHSRLKQKSSNTNFAVLATIQFTQPFNDPVGYGAHIARLANILGGDKVILQTYQNFKDSKRTKRIYRVHPTLPQDEFILGDINLAYPRRIIESIIDFIENLDNVIPGVANQDNLVYAPEIKFYSNVLNNDQFNNLKFAGDCSGHTRSIIYATAHGYLIAEQVMKK